jgi:putative DNA primase/helicase
MTNDTKTKTTKTTLLDEALAYVQVGIPVFPCKRADKSPLVKGGFKAATTDEEQIREWWRKWPNAMIGMPTGAPSGIDVLDIDFEEAEYVNGYHFLPGWRELTPVKVRTPRDGSHLWFKSEGKVRCSTSVIAPGLDTRGDGGYIIVPPSVNEDGKPYRWLSLPDDFDFADLPPFPAELLKKLGPKQEGESGVQPTTTPERIAAAMAVIPNADVGWDEWKRFGLAIWRATGGSDEGFAIWDEWSKKSRKYDADTTHAAWEAITRSPPTRIGAGTIFYYARQANPDFDKQSGALVLPAGAPVPAAEAFVARHHTADDGFALLRHYRGAFYTWTGTHWAEHLEEVLEQDLYRFLNGCLAQKAGGDIVPYNPTKHKVAEVVHALRRGVLIPAKWETPFWLGEKDYKPAGGELVACRNGILNLETRELTAHTPRFFTTNCIPLDFDPHAPKPKRWMQFLGEIWPDRPQEQGYDWVAEETLGEMFGYLLSSDTRQQKLFLMKGPKRGGKGTIVFVLEKLIGRDNVTYQTLNSMTGEFGRWPLIDKKLAVIADARLGSRNTSSVTETLLSISGGDPQTINRKYGSFWTGRLGVRFLITTNVLPELRDASRTIASRFIVFVLTESFFGKEDTELQAKLVPELAGILNWALDGLKRLRARGHFRQPKSSQDTLQLLEDLAAPVGAFVRDWCEVGKDEEGEELFWSTKQLYQAYRAWASEGGHKAVANNTFGKELRDVVPKLGYRGAGKTRKYVGIALSEEGEDAWNQHLEEKGLRGKGRRDE